MLLKQTLNKTVHSTSEEVAHYLKMKVKSLLKNSSQMLQVSIFTLEIQQRRMTKDGSIWEIKPKQESHKDLTEFKKHTTYHLGQTKLSLNLDQLTVV